MVYFIDPVFPKCSDSDTGMFYIIELRVQLQIFIAGSPAQNSEEILKR